MNLYDNIRKRQRSGTSRSKKKSTIIPAIYEQMKKKKGPFKPKKKK
jgi:hypothetical protein